MEKFIEIAQNSNLVGDLVIFVLSVIAVLLGYSYRESTWNNFLLTMLVILIVIPAISFMVGLETTAQEQTALFVGGKIALIVIILSVIVKALVHKPVPPQDH